MKKFTETEFWKNYKEFNLRKYMMRCTTDAVVLWDFFKQYKFKNYLEIGIAQGGTSGLVLECNPDIKITGIDINLNTGLFYEIYGEQKRTDFEHDSTTFDFTKIDKFDLILIDGSHEEPDVKKDFINTVPHLLPDGVLIVDDVDWPGVSINRPLLIEMGLVPFLRIEQCELWHRVNCNKSRYLDSLFTSTISNFLHIDTIEEFDTTVVKIKSNKFFTKELNLTTVILNHYNI